MNDYTSSDISQDKPIELTDLLRALRNTTLSTDARDFSVNGIRIPVPAERDCIIRSMNDSPITADPIQVVQLLPHRWVDGNRQYLRWIVNVEIDVTDYCKTYSRD